jgi:hypothetical protein
MKPLHLFLFLLSASRLTAQSNIEELIRAEKKFTAYSVAHGTKDAFLKNLDSNGIVFDQGKPTKGIEVWSQRQGGTGVLDWYPTTVEISSAGDFGYSTGPYTYRRSTNDTISARGEFATVWHLDKNGTWKFLIDLGVSNTPFDSDTAIWRKNNLHHFKKGSLSGLMETESAFIASYSKSPSKAYADHLALDATLKRSGFASQSRSFYPLPANVQYKMLGGGISPAKDIGYVYGTASLNGKTDNYMRIWRREGSKWKLVLEILRV